MINFINQFGSFKFFFQHIIKFIKFFIEFKKKTKFSYFARFEMKSQVLPQSNFQFKNTKKAPEVAKLMANKVHYATIDHWISHFKQTGSNTFILFKFYLRTRLNGRLD